MNALPDRARTQRMLEQHGLRRRGRHPAVATPRGTRTWSPGVDLPRTARPAAHAARHLAGGGDAAAGGAAAPRHPPEPRDHAGPGEAARPRPTTSTSPSSSGSRRRPRSCRSTTRSSTSRSTASTPRPGRRSTARPAQPEHRFLTQSGKIELYSAAPRRRRPRPAAGVHRHRRSRRRGRSAWCSAARRPTPTPAPPTTSGWPSSTPTNDLWINPQPAAALGHRERRPGRGERASVGHGAAAGAGHRGDPPRLRVHAARLRQAVAGAAPRDRRRVRRRRARRPPWTGCRATRRSTRPSSPCSKVGGGHRA